ncbi:P-loop containing nucleoside triphosphate hydrolase protein [Gonapodya prolifera JEL478]|uniref:p-loop containing nucleoside triphosphate hydrolase protein n=1 Tax=Gonapodya prolifera (strain JEL478) TaxID=1344416 RepID=A0A139AFC6_GONPJ|nr:P-loop containing nucleoside triphosphate hydrolase protein [Gonapodya prolifera JEL478]|eukprot:KXS15532.1 P-loop containing nucleoside triphosphate hydrolase protein [Gonapodya prolifera JEL478]
MNGLVTGTKIGRDQTVAALETSRGAIDGFRGVFGTTATNEEVFSVAVEEKLGAALAGGAISVFCYGHTGTGKTHTTLGYGDEPGLYSLITRSLLRRLDPGLSLHVRFVELHNRKVYDLLHDRRECHLRENSEGDLCVRGGVEVMEDGRVYAMNQRSVVVATEADVDEVLAKGLAHRATGSSSMHDRSSRSHGVLELEIVSQELISAREAVAEAEAREVPVGKEAIDLSIRFWTKGLFKFEQNHHVVVPSCDGDDSITTEEWMDRVRAEAKAVEEVKQRAHEAKLKHEEVRAYEKRVLASAARSVGGKVTLADLAGADKDERDISSTTNKEEKAESMFINKSLMALGQCIAALATGKGKPPFRDSTLTRVLAPVLSPREGKVNKAVMIVNVSPSKEMAKWTTNSLQYGRMAAGGKDRKGGMTGGGPVERKQKNVGAAVLGGLKDGAFPGPSDGLEITIA